MYAAVLFLGGTNTSAVQSVVAIERTVFYREKAAGMFSALPYAFAQVNEVKSSLHNEVLNVNDAITNSQTILTFAGGC